MTDTAYQPVAHDTAFRQALLEKPGVKQAYDALQDEYTSLQMTLQDCETATNEVSKSPTTF
ncbi:hypothetical protein [Limnohabitans sp. DM1]|uniref:hypothetical protein n=1 Tax=Limnohabitans sp. DM1 TaxID=1597955 RepID=UPI000ACD4D10|nr:hypothetical protein [Limnohabitans sp. DM1]